MSDCNTAEHKGHAQAADRGSSCDDSEGEDDGGPGGDEKPESGPGGGEDTFHNRVIYHMGHRIDADQAGCRLASLDTPTVVTIAGWWQASRWPPVPGLTTHSATTPARADHPLIYYPGDNRQ